MQGLLVRGSKLDPEMACFQTERELKTPKLSFD